MESPIEGQRIHRASRVALENPHFAPHTPHNLRRHVTPQSWTNGSSLILP